MGDNNQSSHYLLKFPKEKIRKRYIFLKNLCTHYIKAHKLESYVRVSKRQLQETLVDYFADIGRLKDFHEIEKTEPLKVAAFTAYWFLRRKPLQLIKDLDKTQITEMPFLKEINEWLCVNILIGMAFITKKRFLLDVKPDSLGGISASKRWKNFIIHTQYYFTYRIVTPQALEFTLLALNVEPLFEPLMKAIQS